MPELLNHLPRSRHRTPCADKNDKLGWTHGLSVRWSGLTIGLRCNCAEVLPELQTALPADALPCQERESDLLLSVIRGGEAGKGRRNYHLVYDHWNRVARTMDWAGAMAAFRNSLDQSRAFLAQEHTLMDCLRTQLDGSSLVICPSPKAREQILQAYPESERWIDMQSLRDPSQVLLVVDEATQEVSQALPPGQAGLELVRFSVAARLQPRLVLDQMAQLSGLVRMYRVPQKWSRSELEAFVQSHPTQG
jgi:hypothetical protein